MSESLSLYGFSCVPVLANCSGQLALGEDNGTSFFYPKPARCLVGNCQSPLARMSRPWALTFVNKSFVVWLGSPHLALKMHFGDNKG